MRFPPSLEGFSASCCLFLLFFWFCSWHSFWLQALQKFQLRFFLGGVLFVSFGSRICPNYTCTVTFSLISFLCILLLEQRCVQVPALQQRVPGSSYLEVWAMRWGQLGTIRKRKIKEGRFLQIHAHHYLHTMRREEGWRSCTWSEGKVHFCRRCQKYCSSPLILYESRPFLHQSGGQRRGWGLWICRGRGSGFQSKLQGLCLSGSAFNLINTGLFPGTSVSHKKTFCSCCCWWPGLETTFRNPGRRTSIINWHLKCFQVISLSSCGVGINL